MTQATSERATMLGRVGIFAGIDPEHLETIAAKTVEIEFPEGRAIVRQGEIGTGLFLIVEGRVRVVRDGTTIATLEPGDFFGELSVLDRGPRLANVVTETATTCLALASWDVEGILESEPRIAIAMLRGLAERLRSATDRD